MFKRRHKAHFIDRNADIRAAGDSTMNRKGDKVLSNCLAFSHPEELAERLVRTHKCGQSNAKWSPLREGPFLPNNSMGDLLAVELQKSRFASFKERFYEELYFNRAKVGETKPAFTKPDSVTNISRTFGHPSTQTPNGSLYSLIMPLRSREEVNTEYTEGHEKRIVSHNHYFPAEQVNRKYSPPFDRHNPCGQNRTFVDSGLMVKSCLTEGESHVQVIGKAQVDFMERTEAPLGKKFQKYLYDVPDITFGVSRPSNGDAKMFLYNIVSDTQTHPLMDAMSHLNVLRLRLRQRNDIDLHYLIAVMERSDPENTGLLTFCRILEILRSYRIRLDPQKIRIFMSHYRMIVDEGLCSERVKFREFCKLLSCHEPLPSLGGVATYAAVDSQDTTYRLLCADLHKQPNVAPLSRKKDRAGVRELLSPDFDEMVGLEATDFSQLRPKVEIEQVFRKLIAKDEFEAVWESLMAKYQDQKGLVSVTQFHEEMKQGK